MYNEFFGFSEKPFEITPDPNFLYLTKVYQEILSALIYGIRERRGFIALVGEVGTGKTMMLNALLDRLDHRTKAAFIFNSDLTFKQMLIMAICDLGIARPEENLSKVEAIQRLNDLAIAQIEKDGYVVIIVDEAQSLSHKTVENLRMLSNLETRKHKLVQIILSGQPELDTKLRKPEWRQLVQRISLKRYSTNLSEEDIYGYIQHRLDTAGFKGPFLFSDEALKLICEYSEGIPRKINIICDNALLIGYGIEKRIINKEIIQEAINDLSWSPFFDAIESQESMTDQSQEFANEQKQQTAPNTIHPNLEEEQNAVLEEELSSKLEEPNVPKLGEERTPDLRKVSKPVFDLKHAQQKEDTLNSKREKDREFDGKIAYDYVTRSLAYRIWSSSITRILIFIFFIFATMYLITKP
jgi:general secretion pathway protein A